MTDTENAKSWYMKDRWLIFIILILVGVTLWNSRDLFFRPPEGYAKFSDYGLSFLYPDDLNLWQVPINDDGSVVLDGSMSVSERSGNVGWNSGNIDFDRGDREGYCQESTVMWVTKETEPGPEDILDLYYTMREVTNRVRGRTSEMVKGSTASFTHRGHQATYQFFNYTIPNPGATESTTIYGIVGGFYCDKTERAVAIYYLDIFDTEPVYNMEEILSSFQFNIGSIKCH